MRQKDAGALQGFVDAVLDLSDDPSPANLERYLAASRSLEQSRLAEKHAARPGRRAMPPATRRTRTALP